MKRLTLFVSLIALLALPMQLFALPLVDIEAAVGGWRQSPNGYISYETDDRIDLEDVLDYGDETRFMGRLKIGMPFLIPNVYLMASPMEFEETATTDDGYKFGDIDIPPDVRFESELVLDQYDIGFYYDIPLLETATFNRLNIELGINTRIYDAEATVAQKTVPGIQAKDSEKETIVVPMAYLGVCVRPMERFALEGEFRGTSYRDSDLYSLIGRLKVNTIGPFFVTGGYRYETGESHDWDLEFDADFSGPFLEAGVQF